MNTNQWLHSILTIARHYRINTSEEQLKLHLAWGKITKQSELIDLLCTQMGLKHQIQNTPFTAWQLPLITELNDGQILVVESMDQQQRVSVHLSQDQGLYQTLSLEELYKNTKAIHIFRPESAVSDVRVDEYIKPYQKSWFWHIVLADWKRYADIMLASLLTNLLALATILFSMNVYDRVIPAQSIPTLWVLTGGVLLAAIFELVLRMSRTYLSDLIGKRADLKISDRVFGHALRIKNNERPKSTGTFISQIRELESIREMVTSTTVGALADLPFFLLFLGVLWFIGHHIFWVVVAVVPFMIIPALLSQKKLAQLANEGIRESSIRNAMLVETVQNIEDIKLLRAESRFQNQWNHINAVSADISMQQRKIGSFLNSWTYKLQNLTYVLVILVGSFAVMQAEMSTGTLVACSILASRMLAPISQITAILGKWQNAKVAKRGLDELMKKPVDHPEASRLIHKPAIFGSYVLDHLTFKYDTEQTTPTLAIQQLRIQAGEKIAILGRNGAGKSALLQILSGMQFATEGKITLDHTDLSLLNPDDIRRDVGLLNQSAQLFYGTIRENLTLGAPLATDEDIVIALSMVNAVSIVESKKEGLDHLVLEGGIGFSGGQKQALLLARLILKNPKIVLLDEPTAAIDDVSEKLIIDQLKPWLASRTLIVTTHKQAVLQWVDRVLVMQDGQVVKDVPQKELFATAA
ncbi:type I secretion system permease/ATPase [Acinetobacter sp. HY1485]|uniref:type I secretion system permease/ATPase n=1 Tax=Acinetobacter sp. HY1485 TaxID=2970918 RepID=UPI0022B9A0DF|nr:type I secretion system permease/ATPase [Acinetobacter sp. HY1485]